MPLNTSAVAAFTNSIFIPGSHATTASYASDTLFASSSGGLSGSASYLTSVLDVGTGTMLLTFTNVSGAPFTVFSTPAVSWPLTDWTPRGPVTEVSPGQYRFLDALPATDGGRFFNVRSP